MTVRALNVFVNCPFDDDYKPLFEALIFAITACGYRVRCALEENNSGDIRFDKLCRLIHDSDRSVHDLSRVELGGQGLPRFNMPFEYGLFLGASRFGGKRHRAKTALAMIAEPYELPIYLSDVAGSDPFPHHAQTIEVVRVVRIYLGARPDGGVLPGASHIHDTFTKFKSELPKLAAALKIAEDEIDPLRDYRDYLSLLTEYLLQS